MAGETTEAQGDQRAPEVTFLGFLMSLAQTAAIHFGDIADPTSGQKAEPNLAAARQMIDVLDLLEEKTRGNLTPEERQVLEQLLYELRLRAVETQKPKSSIILP
jgi:hypothetical protein